MFNPDKMTEPLVIKGLGDLYIDSKGKVRGQGRKFFYFQVLSSDKSDNYAANSASAKKWGDKSAYNLLEGCTTDKACWEALLSGYNTLYEKPIVVKGWRGEDVTADAMYMLQENADMAHMLRTDADFINVKQLLNNLGIK